MKFIGRIEEQKTIDSIFSKEDFQTYLLYGRRRIGKTELIYHCATKSKKKYLYVLCQQGDEKINVRVIKDALVTLVPSVDGFLFKDVYSILKYIFDISLTQEFIFILDEFQFLKEAVPNIETILMSFIENYKRTSKMKLVLLGSYVHIMEGLIKKESPLYGRFPINDKLEAMNYLEASGFYPNYSNEDKVRFYSLFGGIPYYLSTIDQSLSFEENLLNLLSRKGAFIRSEINNFILQEVGKIESASSVFEAISSNYIHFSDIQSQAHINSPASLMNVLAELLDMGVIKKESPINKPNDKKKSRYILKDNFVRFYFTYLYPHLSALEIMDTRLFYARYIKDDFETQYVPHAFEDICRQYLERKNFEGTFNPPFEAIGRYWYDLPKERKNGEFDIVGKSDDEYSFFECKYKNKVLEDSDVLGEKTKLKDLEIKADKVGFFSKAGFDLKNETLDYSFSLNDLYK